MWLASRSDNPAAAGGLDTSEAPAATPPAGSSTGPAAGPGDSSNAQPDNNGIPELKPNVPDDSGQNTPPPAQLNEIQNSDNPASIAGTPESKTNPNTASSSSSSKQEDDANVSSSRKKKKKHKLLPF